MTAKITKKAAESSSKKTATEIGKSEIINAATRIKVFINSTFAQHTKADKLKVNHEYWKILKAE